ncbi:hypothetical protein [Ensifer aridi]|uniref:hypothetical protein n=1 Tax=Ensifer aridi TaxID=1708715 RepID=UPI000A0F72E4|nr:hypothetical protein [Ensifer aridi]
MCAMNQHEEIKDKPPLDPATGQPTPRAPEVETRSRRSSWPLLIILLAGLVLALIAWLPAELTRDAENEPAAPGQSTTTAPTGQSAPGDQTTPPAGEAATPAAPDTQPQTPAPAPTPTTPTQPQSTPAQ